MVFLFDGARGINDARPIEVLYLLDLHFLLFENSGRPERTNLANRKILGWQSGYGVVTFGTGHLPWVRKYVRDQRKRHANGQTFDRLEWTEPPEEDEAC